MKDSWDKLLLIVVAILVIGLGGLFITKALSFKNQFDMESARPKDEMPETRTGQTDIATNYVKRATNWVLPGKGTPPKPLPLFVSIPIVEMDGRTINLGDPNAEMIRPPVANKWLLDNQLDFLNKSVLNQDPDGDGYTNLEEWNGKTDPKSAESHPPYADKLVLAQRRSQVYRALFAAKPDDQRYQIQRLPSAKWPKRENFYVMMGGTTDDQQLRLDSFEQKQATNNIGITVDASVLSVTFLPTGTKHQLVRKVVEEIPTYYGELEFLLEPGKTFFVKEGDTFPIARDPNTKYRLVKVTEDLATISYETGPGQTETVEIKKK